MLCDDSFYLTFYLFSSSMDSLTKHPWTSFRFSVYLPEFVYWWIDGLITTFAVVAGATWANLDFSVVLILWCANLFADWFSMSVGAYLSAKAQKEQTTQALRTMWGDDTTLDLMHNPVWDWLATFVSFLVMWAIPLLAYGWYYLWLVSQESLLITAVWLTWVWLAFIWLLKSYITRLPVWRWVLETLLLWLLAAAVAYYVGFYLESLVW
jgi:VIT1/CCC1 family predicted Fe2+/Mn2+ transporter